jgi:hypothetical protein
VKGSEILLTPDFPHGTKAGYDRGCKGGSCPAAIPCRDVRRRYLSDADFRRLIDAGVSLEEIVSIDRAAAETDAAIEKRRRRGQPDPAPVTVASADAAEARRPTPSPPAVRPETFVKPVADVDEQWGDVGHLVEQSAPDAVPAADLTPRQREQEEVRRRTVAAEGRNARRILDALAPGPRKWAVRKVWMAIAPDGSTHGPFEEQQEALTFVSAQFPAPELTSLSPTSDEPEPQRRTRRVWTDADEARARALWGRGLTDSAIAREMDKDRGALARRLRSLGLAANDGPRLPRPAKVKTPSKPREVQGHGTNASYARGCRCDDCKAAARAYQRDYVARRKAEGVPADRHGTAYGYQLGCKDRATCPAEPTCTDVVLAKDIDRRRAQGVPEQAPMVAAEPVRDHVRALMAAVIRRDDIADAAEVSRSILGTLLYGRSDRKGVQQEQIKAETARRVLALPIPTKTPTA